MRVSAAVFDCAAYTNCGAEDIYNTLTSITNRLALLSTPAGKSGMFYRVWSQAMKGDGNILALQLPTWEVNPTLPSSFWIAAYWSDPAGFQQEYGAKFADQHTKDLQ